MTQKEITSSARMLALKEAITKFTDLDDIMSAAKTFHDFLTQDELIIETGAPEGCEATTLRVINKERTIVGMTPVRECVLYALIDIECSGANIVTQAQIAKAVERSSAAVKSTLLTLARDGYVASRRNGKRIEYRALKRPDGTLIDKSTSETVDGVKVTKCPPRYAGGFGTTPYNVL